ncbi:MAG: hypothetical protein A2X08_01380 [Bacteroidetes bacterium GWA2_32_17]|nr:MAG: hypothetical protein A2X08_01380 [Bacteroidetes bacterium GWA2_32_17]
MFACCSKGISQPDTNLYQTTTSQNVATWLKNLPLPTGAGHISVLDPQMGALLISPNGRNYVNNNSMAAYYLSGILFNTDLNLAGQELRSDFRNMQRAGVFMARSPTLMPWGVIEPTQGSSYHYEFVDSTVKIAGIYGVPIVGTVLPYADWSQTCNPVNSNCPLFIQGDFFFLNNNKTGPICSADTTYFYQFVQNLVERYDGDGVNDMPGLTLPITIWEFGNEPETPCGQYSATTYSTDQNIFKRAMKSACPSCKLINGGYAGFLPDSVFWNDVILNSYADLDIGNIHSNNGRNKYPFSFTNMLYGQAQVFQQQINQLSLNWNIWMTEWGIYCGSPGGSLPTRTEEEQASLYTKLYCWSAANNITNYFYDLKGLNDSIGGSSALIQIQGPPNDTLAARLFFYTQKLYEYKFRDYDSVKVVQFDTSTAFATGDIRFYKSGNTHYVLWGLSSLPPGLSGVRNMTDIYGNVTTQNVSSLTLPLGSKPIIIEDTLVTISVNELSLQNKFSVYPNPFSVETTLKINRNFKNATLTVYNSFGQAVKQIDNLAGQTIIFNRDNLPSGLHFIRLTQENKVIATDKIIITD